MRRWVIVAGLVGLWATAAQAQPATRPGAEAKLVQDLYGKRIARALATAEGGDNIALSRELLLAAADPVNPQLLRHLLAMAAVKVAAPAGGAEGAKLAREALALANRLQKLKPVLKRELELRIAERRYDAAWKAGADMKARAPLAAKLVEAQIGLARALMAEEELERAKTILTTARGKARAHRLTGAEVDVEAAFDSLRAFAFRLERIRRAETQLQRARLAANAESIKSSRQRLGLIYLFADGDLAKANSYLAGTGHKYEAAVKAALEFTLNPKKLPPGRACTGIVEWLGQAAKAAENKDAQLRIATAGMNLCRGFLASSPRGLVATKARLLLIQMEKLAGDSPADRLARKLKASYGSLEGKVEVLQQGVVRISYDFSNQKQLGDWSNKDGQWQVARIAGKEVLVGLAGNRNRARTESRLRFRAHKPLSLSFLASGRESLTGILIFLRRNDPRYGTHVLEFDLGAYGNRESVLRESGWGAWRDTRAKLVPNTTYKIEINWDGERTVAWSVNDKLLCSHEIRFRQEDMPYTSLAVGLQTWSSSAGFDELKVEGVIMQDPSERLKRPR